MINNENITSNRVSKKKVNYYTMLLRNSKELTDSYFGEESFKIINIHFKKSNSFSKQIDFYGNIESENESRYITGSIFDLNGYEVFIKDATVIRLGVPIEENGIYTFGETFCRLDQDEILRITRYGEDIYIFNRINREDFYNPVIVQSKVLVRGK